MAGVFSALNSGLQSGFDMGLRADQADRAAKQTAFENQRQLDADARATEDLKIRQGRESREADRQGVLSQLGAIQHANGLLKESQTELERRSTAALTAGQDIDPNAVTAYSRNRDAQTRIRQQGIDLATRLAGGLVQLSDVPPKDLVTSIAASTGFSPEELPKVQAASNDLQAAIQQGNTGLVTQSMNTIMAPQLRRSVGKPSPHGGNITRVEIIGLDPAVDANGQSHPDKFIPRLRVHTDLVNPDTDQPLYYDAPMTENGSTDPQDPPKAISIGQGMNMLGNLGTLATAIQQPGVAATLKRGMADMSAEERSAYNDLLGIAATNVQNAKASPEQNRINLIHKLQKELATERGEKVTLDEAASFGRKHGLLGNIGVGASTLNAQLDAIDGLDIADDAKERLKQTILSGGTRGSAGVLNARISTIDSLNVSTAEKERLKRDVALGGGGKTTGLIPVKGGATRGSGGGGAGGGGLGAPMTVNGKKINPDLAGQELLDALPKDDAATVKALAEGKLKLNQIDNPKNSGRRERFARLALQYDPNSSKVAGGADIGARESVFINRVLLSANEGARDLQNVVELPLSASTGLFGGRKQGPSILDAGREVLANKLTTEEVQEYNTMATGFQRALASIESAGLVPSGALSHQMDAVLFKEGDTNFVKLRKLAQTRQIIEAGLETTIANPRVPEETRKHAKDIVDTVRKAVPFTQQDLTRLKTAQGTNPDMTLKDVAKTRGVVSSESQGGAAPAQRAAPPGVQTATNPKTGQRLMLQNGQWVPLQ